MDPAAWSRGGFNRGRASGTWNGSGGFKLAKSIRVSGRGELEDRTMEMGAVKNYQMDGFISGESVSVGDEQMSAQDSHFVTVGVLPSLGARSNRRVKLGRFLISPYDPRYRAWETFLIVLVFYSAWASLFEFGFIKEQKGVLFVADLIVDFFFAIDIIMTFYVPYLDRRTDLLVDRRESIAKRYICTWFLFDVCSTVPFEAVRRMFRGRSTGFSYNALSMLRLWRLKRVCDLFARLEKDVRINYFWTRCAKLLCGTLFVVHCAGCFKYWLAARHGDKRKTWIGAVYPDFMKSSLLSRYVTTIYLSSTTVTYGGYGDLHAQNTEEMIFDIFSMLLNLGLMAYLTGNVTNLVVHSTSMQTQRSREKIQAASRFASRNQLPPNLEEQMLKQLSLEFMTEDLLEEEILNNLPKCIRAGIANFLLVSVLEKAYLFQGVSYDFLFQLASEMKVERFAPGVDFILKSEAPSDFYVLVSGAVEILADKDKDKTIGQSHPGDVFGEIGALGHRPQPYTVRTNRHSKLLRLDLILFLNIVESNIADKKTLANNLLEHLKELKDPIFGEIAKEIDQWLAERTMDVPVSLCYVASIADTHLMEQLLKIGMDPNESDSNNRTPLHIAAASGFEDCVRLLLQYGADVNSKDKGGSVPVIEAIQGRHKSIAKLLWKKGADASFLCVAAQNRDFDTLNGSLRYGADINATNGDGRTALDIAIHNMNESINVVKYLLEHGADINKTHVRMHSSINLRVKTQVRMHSSINLGVGVTSFDKAFSSW